jgi:hypothetical protein
MVTIKELAAKADNVDECNTNNAWGFGGSIGKTYQFGGVAENGSYEVEVFVGKNCYRHSGTSGRASLYVKGKKVAEARSLRSIAKEVEAAICKK